MVFYNKIEGTGHSNMSTLTELEAPSVAVLQCVAAVCCSVLQQGVAGCCSRVLQGAAVCCGALPCIARRKGTLSRCGAAGCCIVLQ